MTNKVIAVRFAAINSADQQGTFAFDYHRHSSDNHHHHSSDYLGLVG